MHFLCHDDNIGIQISKVDLFSPFEKTVIFENILMLYFDEFNRYLGYRRRKK